jgi:Tfp pilus assembly protein PilF
MCPRRYWGCGTTRAATGTRAHQIVQDDPSAASAWVHAYLHRKEGDISNAHYWYRRAGKTPYTGSLESEWEHIVRELLQTHTG